MSTPAARPVTQTHPTDLNPVRGGPKPHRINGPIQMPISSDRPFRRTFPDPNIITLWDRPCPGLNIFE